MFNNKILEPTQTYRPQKSCERKRQVQEQKNPEQLIVEQGTQAVRRKINKTKTKNKAPVTMTPAIM